VHERARSFDERANSIPVILTEEDGLSEGLKAGAQSSSELLSPFSASTGDGYQELNQQTFQSWKSVFSWRSSGKGSYEAQSKRDGSIVSESLHDIRLGSNKFRFLAKQVSSGLDIHSPKEAKKVARRIFDAFSPATAELIKAFQENPRHMNEDIIKAATTFQVTDTIALQNIGAFNQHS
jgi:hypothetical protein